MLRGGNGATLSTVIWERLDHVEPCKGEKAQEFQLGIQATNKILTVLTQKYHKSLWTAVHQNNATTTAV
jgi:hypothetical protein